MPDTYPLSPEGTFFTVQGEGALLGTPMVFVRFGGCDVNCPGCDAIYTVRRRATAEQIADEAVALATPSTQWAFLTGGEPTLYDLPPLVAALRARGFRVALATAGERPVREGSASGGVDFLSVSPHRWDRWVQRSGTQLNVVPGLNGLRLEDMPAGAADRFAHRYVTPQWGDAESLRRCVEWVRASPGWSVGVQAHKVWRLP